MISTENSIVLNLFEVSFGVGRMRVGLGIGGSARLAPPGAPTDFMTLPGTRSVQYRGGRPARVQVPQKK